MKEFWTTIQVVFAGIGGWLVWFLGGCDGLLYALLAFVVIDYVTGDSYQTSTPSQPSGETTATYILNTGSKKFHKPSCSSVNKISAANKKSFTGKRSDLISQGYSPCGTCKP